MRWPGFVGGSDTAQSLIADCEKTVNLYVERLGPTAKNSAALFPTPGFRTWGSSTSDVGCRGAVNVPGRGIFVIFGGGLWEFSSAGGVGTRRGDVAQDEHPAQIIYNGVVGNQLGIASGGAVYSYDLATNILTASVVLTTGITHLAYANGSGLAFNPTTGKVYPSSLNDLSSYDLANFFRRSLFPDPWQAMFVDTNNLIWLIGTDTYEVWYYGNPASTQPFTPLSGLSGRYGIVAPFASWVSSMGLGWLATSEGGVHVVSNGGQSSGPAPISSFAVDTAIAGYQRTSVITNAEVLLYADQGHIFSNVTFPSGPGTWTVDLKGNGWAQRGPWNATRGDYDAWTPRIHVAAFGKHLVGDRMTGTLWEMDTTFTTEMDGTSIRRMRRAPAITDEHKRHPIDQIEILMDVGVAGVGIVPEMTMKLSSDGGRTYGNERLLQCGRTGEYLRRVVSQRWGAPADAVLECVWTCDAPVRIVDAWLNNQERIAA